MFTKEYALKLCDERGISLPQHRECFVEGYFAGHIEGWKAALEALSTILQEAGVSKKSIPHETR